MSNLTFKKEIWSYGDAEAFLDGAKTRKLAHNTHVVRRSEDKIAVRYHDTDIVTYRRDSERIELYANGWVTRTTSERIHRLTPSTIEVRIKNGEFLVNGEAWDRWEPLIVHP